ncbi:hypothetical protein [Streptomyces sp. NPDC050264]|uniref:hypothetical protein n=1 Tax=Streptomyces sp. NPDC050264 TaxID=3155038 RepID=UPI0034496EC7
MISVRPSLVAAWFHRLLTRPVVEFDGRASARGWGTHEVRVPPGEHHVRVFFRYRGQRGARLAEADTRFVTRPEARRVEISARLGPRNGSRFPMGEPVVR